MIGEPIHHECKRKNMRCHDEYQDEGHRDSHYFTTNGACNELASICKAANLWECELELSDDIASIGSSDTQEENQKETAMKCQLRAYCII